MLFSMMKTDAPALARPPKWRGVAMWHARSPHSCLLLAPQTFLALGEGRGGGGGCEKTGDKKVVLEAILLCPVSGAVPKMFLRLTYSKLPSRLAECLPTERSYLISSSSEEKTSQRGRTWLLLIQIQYSGYHDHHSFPFALQPFSNRLRTLNFVKPRLILDCFYRPRVAVAGLDLTLSVVVSQQTPNQPLGGFVC